MPAALTCVEVRAREWDFVEGTLPIPERLLVQAHLDACVSCLREITLCRSAGNALLSAPAHIPTAGDLRAGFYLRLAAEQRPARRYGRPVAFSALAACLLALALFRPALPSHGVLTPGHPGETLARSYGLRPTAVLPALPPAGTETAAVPLNSAPGLSDAAVERLLASVDSRSLIAPRHHHRSVRYRAARRPVSHRMVAVLTPRPEPLEFGRVATRSLQDGSRLRFREVTQVDRSALEKSTDFAKNGVVKETHSDLRALALGKPEPPVADKLRDPRTTLLEAVTTMPMDAGVSLEVTDQVRGFSNTTRLASDIEVQGDRNTIQLESGGN